jgi:tetratricopeptide (TPR) repeat protein
MTEQKLTDAIPSNDQETKLWKSRFSAAKGAYATGDFHQCETLLFRALEQAKALKDRTFATNTCHLGLGVLYLTTGKSDKARAQLETAINALSNSGDPALKELYAVALRFHSEVFSEAGDFPNAESELKKALQILEDIGTEGAVQLAYTTSDLAGLYVAQGNLKDAKELIFTAMDLLETTLGTESADYMRANMIYNICDSESEEQLLTQVEDNIYAMQYQYGQKHPIVIRALRRYLKKRKQLGETEKIAEAEERFKLHAKALNI